MNPIFDLFLGREALPPSARRSSSIISKAEQRNIPLLLVSQDTYRVSTQIDAIESLVAKEDTQKIALLEQLVRKHVNLKEVAGEKDCSQSNA